MIRLATFLALVAIPSQAAEFEFCWVGANGYRMAGTMVVDDAAIDGIRNSGNVTEESVIGFGIRGTRNGVPIGSWSLDQITPTTRWHINFNIRTMTFATGGISSGSQGQEWNANGSASNCGAVTFGFNAGSGGQDLCIENTWQADSSIPPATPFPLYHLGEGPVCTEMPLLGALSQADRDTS